MKFLWRKTLERITGSGLRCPICGADGLVVTERDDRSSVPDIRGIPYCECPACRIRDEFPVIVAMASSRGVDDTVRELHRIGELDASARDIDEYVSRKRTQTDVKGHMSRCVAALRAAPHLGGIRAGLSVATIRQLPPDTGLHTMEELPHQFSVLSGQRYARVPMTLYAYKFDGEISCVDAQNPKTLQREHRIRITGDEGVYLGDFRAGEVPPVIVGTHNPRIAGQIYGAIRAETSLPSPVVGIAGFPLPGRFSAVSTLYLLDAPDSPLPLAFALQAVSRPVVYGTDYWPTVKVLTPKCPSSDITAADVRALSNGRTHGKGIMSWIVERILYSSDRGEELANALLQAGVSENVRADIVAHLGEAAPKSLIDTVMLPTTEPDDVFTLGNGRSFKSTPVGIYTVSRNGKSGDFKTRSLLCNVGIAVESRIVDKGCETACCRITHPDADVPSATVRIPKSHWNNPDAIAEDIRTVYAEFGRTPYVALYRSSGYGWADIIQFLGSHCPVQSGIRTLGATPEGAVNLPNAVISREGVSAQTKASTLDPKALYAFSALEGTTAPEDEGGLARFLSSAPSLVRVGVAAGVLHALYCMAGRMFDGSGVRRQPSHLVFVETEAGVWDTTIRTIAYLFSGSEYVPLVDYGDRSGFLAGWSALGTLPLVTRIPAFDDIASVLANSPVSVIAVADPLTAVLCSGRGTVSFVLPNIETPDSAALSPEEISALRHALVYETGKHAGTGWLDIGQGGAFSLSTPCLSALGSLTDVRDQTTIAGGLYRSVKGRYPGVGLTGSSAFFGVLHRSYAAQTNRATPEIRITFVTGAPPDAVKASFNERGEHVFILPDVVLVSRSVVALINRAQSFLFDAEQLSREFDENGILLHDAPGMFGIDPSRVWAFRRNVWDSEVVRAAGFDRKTQNKGKKK